MQFDASRIPVAQAAIKSIIEKCSGTNDETALKIAGGTEIEIGILKGVIDPNGVLCGGTAAVGRTRNEFLSNSEYKRSYKAIFCVGKNPENRREKQI